MAALLTAVAVRVPHHDDTALVQMRIGEWQAVRGFEHLDEGRVTFVGEPCGQLWLAGHRSTHGAPFARLPELRVGDTISVWASVGCTYRVTATAAVTSNVRPPFGDLLVQCSLPGGFFLVWGERI